jgi:hypothetical protein
MHSARLDQISICESSAASREQALLWAAKHWQGARRILIHLEALPGHSYRLMQALVDGAPQLGDVREVAFVVEGHLHKLPSRQLTAALAVMLSQARSLQRLRLCLTTLEMLPAMPRLVHLVLEAEDLLLMYGDPPLDASHSWPAAMQALAASLQAVCGTLQTLSLAGGCCDDKPLAWYETTMIGALHLSGCHCLRALNLHRILPAELSAPEGCKVTLSCSVAPREAAEGRDWQDPPIVPPWGWASWGAVHSFRLCSYSECDWDAGLTLPCCRHLTVLRLDLTVGDLEDGIRHVNLGKPGGPVVIGRAMPQLQHLYVQARDVHVSLRTLQPLQSLVLWAEGDLSVSARDLACLVRDLTCFYVRTRDIDHPFVLSVKALTRHRVGSCLTFQAGVTEMHFPLEAAN